GIASRLFQHFRLERWILAGLALLACGIGLNGWLLSNWYRGGLGPLDVQITLRYASWGFTAMILGAQTIFGSFFLGTMELAGRGGHAAPGTARARTAVGGETTAP